MNRTQQQLLELLIQHPLLSPDQLGVLAAAHPNHVRAELQPMRTAGWIARLNPRSPEMEPRALFYPTAEGVHIAAREAEAPRSLSFQRLVELWLVLERAYHVRNLILRLNPQWKMLEWNVELDEPFWRRGGQATIHLHGAGLAQAKGNVVPFVVEYDSAQVPINARRLTRMVQWRLDPRFLGRERSKHFPILLLVAQDANRLTDYYAFLRSAALARGLPLPHAYLTTILSLTYEGVTAPIWYSTASGSKTTLFADQETVGPRLDDPPFTGLDRGFSGTLKRTQRLDRLQFDSARPTTLTSLAALKCSLSPLAKEVLNEIAAHPMLSSSEIAGSLHGTERGVEPVLKELSNFHVIRVESRNGEERFVLTRTGIAYLAAVDGFGRAVKGYAFARGWKHGTTSMIRHWEHTRSENRFFLQLAQVARVRGARVTWRSELECRLYYEARGRRLSFLPDGDATYQDARGQVHLALEIDRSRASTRKLRHKFAQYLASWQSRVYGALSEGDLRLLVVTTGWQRAQVLRSVVLDLARQFRTAAPPILVTTFEMLERPGLEGPIWHRVDTWERCTCIESWESGLR